MTIIERCNAEGFYQVDILDGFCTFAVPASQGANAHTLLNTMLDELGFENRAMQMGTNPLFSKTADEHEHIIATMTRYSGDGSLMTIEEIRREREMRDVQTTSVESL